jgi:hypothetical protein
MGPNIWLAADTLYYPKGGGYLWYFLHWALGLQALGCRVIWLEAIDPQAKALELQTLVPLLTQRLGQYGLTDCLALCSRDGEPLPKEATVGCWSLAEAGEADLLLDLAYHSSDKVVGRFRRSALVDIDPGLLQIWISEGQVTPARHDIYFSTGETVGRPGALFPDCGIEWHHTPKAVATHWWSACAAPKGAPYTTVSHWETSKEWVTFNGESYHNDKRSGFLPFLDVPKLTPHPLELAICLGPGQDEEKRSLEAKGWRVVHAHDVTATPQDYERYVRCSRGEFSCAKPSCMRLQNAWVSDRTLAYLASGKPAVVQNTGPSRFLPNGEGLFRFSTPEEAAQCLDHAEADYDRHCRLARALAEEFFDARKVAGRVLERALACTHWKIGEAIND